ALDTVIELLPTAPKALTLRSRIRVHLGTAEVMARCHPVEPIRPGSQGLVRLALEAQMLARGGDRLVIRSYSPIATIRGGAVIDPIPPRRANLIPDLASADPIVRLRALVGRRPLGLESKILPQLIGLPAPQCQRLAQQAELVLVEGRYLTKESLDRLS